MRNKLIGAFACTTALASAGVASAADLGARPYVKAPVYAEPLFNWTGFYVGGHIGGAWTNEQFVNNGNDLLGFGDLVPGQGFRQRSSGIMGGAQIGYNWQANNFVAGLEGTISGLNNKGTVANTVFGAGDDVFDWREWASPLHEWANPYLQVNAVWPGTYDIPPIPDEPPELRTRYTPDDALPVDLLRYRADEAHSARV